MGSESIWFPVQAVVHVCRILYHLRVLAGPLWSVYEGERQGRLVMDTETQKRGIVRYTAAPRFSSGHTVHFNVSPRLSIAIAEPHAQPNASFGPLSRCLQQ
jgi:hypothetical protein